MKIIKKLGEGSYSNVYKVKDEKGNVYAMKQFKIKTDKEKAINYAKKELEILKKLSYSPNCNKYIACVYDYKIEGNDIYILSEFIDGKNLYEMYNDYINYDIHDRLDLEIKIATGIGEIHKHNIAHLDIKPENIMIDAKGDPKIIDFNFACDNIKVECRKTGSELFMAPELTSKKEMITVQEFKKADIYSLGVSFYEFFNDGFEYKTGKKSDSGIHRLDILIHSMLSEDPKNRPSIKKVIKELNYINDTYNTGPEIIQFYRGYIKSISGYYYDQILEFDNYELEIKHDFIQSLFPSFTKGQAKSYLLTNEALQIFIKDENLKKRVLQSLKRMIEFYGYNVDFEKGKIKRVSPIDRKIKDTTIGLYSEHNYLRITRILHFLSQLGLQYYGQVFMLGLCNDLKTDKKFYKKAKGSIHFWIGAIATSLGGDFEKLYSRFKQ